MCITGPKNFLINSSILGEEEQENILVKQASIKKAKLKDFLKKLKGEL